MNTAITYIDEIIRLAEGVKATQAEAIEAAAQLCAEVLGGRGYIFTFGTGHSHIMAEEIFYRAGGPVRVYPILEDSLMLHRAAARSSQMERAPGLAKLLLDDIDCIREGGVIFIFSNSGRNTVAVDMALEAKERGLVPVCLTNLNHSRSVSSRHPSGKKLYEVCDIVLDNLGCIGDAAVNAGGYTVGATSTAVGAMIMQAIMCRATQLAAEKGSPEVFLSGNVDGGDTANERYIAQYKPIIKSL